MRLFYVAILIVLPGFIHAQTITEQPVRKKHKHSYYFSWGYNGERYTNTNLKIKQGSLGNDYTMHDVQLHDHKGWDETSIFKQQLSIPQYNYRLGYMFNEAKGLGIEINFDHTKCIVGQDQNVRLSGTFNGRQADTLVHLGNDFHYYLNNGANFFLINIVKRKTLYESRSEWLRVDGLGKAGVGPVVPHVDNMLFGKQNDPGFQFGGWNVGVEADIKATIYKYVYLEYGAKLDYARYSNLKVYEGTAKQAFATFEMILSLGINVPGKKK